MPRGNVDSPRRMASLNHSRRLARRLVDELRSSGIVDDRTLLSAAFRRFLSPQAADKVDVERSLAELAARFRSSHPSPHFFEILTTTIAAHERRQAGVFYTPQPVADYLVRSVNQLAETLGFDKRLHCVDPACGAGVLLQTAARSMANVDRLSGFDICPSACDAARMLNEQEECPTEIRCVNPLLAGDDLESVLLDGRPLVVLSNPPYANFGRPGRGEWMQRLLDDYKTEATERKTNLTDAFIQFLRWGQCWIDRAGCGILAVITNRTYLGGITHGGMRRSLAASFPEIHLLDLHGDLGDADDENVFPIRRGTAIALFVKPRDAKRSASQVLYQSLRGPRETKLDFLQGHDCLSPRGQCLSDPGGPWVVRSLGPSQRTEAFHDWTSLRDVFEHSISGVQTKNDALFVDFDREVLIDRMQRLLATEGIVFPRRPAEPCRFDERCVRPYYVGPWDRRWIYYEPALLGRARHSVMRHMLRDNLALVFMRQSHGTRGYDHALAINGLASDRVFFSLRGAPFVAPLDHFDGERRCSNIAAPFRAATSNHLQREAADRELFAYVYAVLHSSAYRREFEQELRRDFPRIPPPYRATFSALVALGERLLTLHLNRSRAQENTTSNAIGTIIARGYPRYVGGRMYLNREVAIDGVTPDDWEFAVGGYSVLRQWIKSRRGRTFTNADGSELSRLLAVARGTKSLIAAIDDVWKDGPFA